MRLDLPTAASQFPTSETPEGRHFGEVEAETEATAGQRELVGRRKKEDPPQHHAEHAERRPWVCGGMGGVRAPNGTSQLSKRKPISTACVF
jgi:hypothetical protein